MKGAILFSATNAASLNIMRHLEQDWKWRKKSENRFAFSACGKAHCCTGFEARGFDKSIIEIEPPSDVKADYFLYASTHKSEAGTPALTAHVPGNWDAADFGGSLRTLNLAYASKLKQILQFLAEGAKKRGLDWPVNLEVDHHGPTPKGGKQALIFVEIGSGPDQWSNEVAGAVVAHAMFKALLRPAPVAKTYLGIGGGHYAPKFTPFMLGSEGRAVGHVLPKYRADSFDAQMLEQAVEKTVEKVEGALIDWKGLSGEQREKILPILENAGMKWEKI